MDAIDISIFPGYFENFFSLCFRQKSEDIHVLLVLYQKPKKFTSLKVRKSLEFQQITFVM